MDLERAQRMDVFLIGWILMGAIAVADNRRLRKELKQQKEHVRHCTQTLGRRLSALEQDDRRTFVWERMIRGIVESTN